MPAEQAAGAHREAVTHLEAFGRLLAGLAPWLELPPDETTEGKLRSEYAALARRALAVAVDPSSPDFLNFTRERQPLVDAAFLAQGLLRAPRTLGDALEATTRERLVQALESTRVIIPPFNGCLHRHRRGGARKLGLRDRVRWIRLRQPAVVIRRRDLRRRTDLLGLLHSLVIQPMLIDVLEACSSAHPSGRRWFRSLQRASTHPPSSSGSSGDVSRSAAPCYRFGAFHPSRNGRRSPARLARPGPRRADRGHPRSSKRPVPSVPTAGCASASAATSLASASPTSRRAASTFARSGFLPRAFPGAMPTGSPAEPWTSVRAWSGQAFPIGKPSR